MKTLAAVCGLGKRIRLAERSDGNGGEADSTLQGTAFSSGEAGTMGRGTSLGRGAWGQGPTARAAALPDEEQVRTRPRPW